MIYTVGGNYIETLVSPNHGGQIRRHCEAYLGESSKSYHVYFQHRNYCVLSFVDKTYQVTVYI